MITAKEAHKKTNETIINNNKEQLDKIEKMIIGAIKQGKYCIALEEHLTDPEYELFRKMGYQYNECWDSTVNKFRYWIRW